MRHTYSRSDETYDVLKSHVGPIALEYPCVDKFIYAIKNGDSKDPFPPFEHLFMAAARAGAPVEVWLRKLAGHLERAKGKVQKVMTLAKGLADKITADSESTSEILDAIADHQLDRDECNRILHSLEVSEDINKGIRRQVESRLAELNSGLKAV